MMLELKTILDYLVMPTIMYLLYLHRLNFKNQLNISDLKTDLYKVKTDLKYQAQCCSDINTIKKDVHKLLIYFEIEHKEKDIK